MKLCLLAIVFALSSCIAKTEIPTEFPTPEPPPSATPLPKLELKRDSDLEKQFAEIAKDAKGKVGAAAVVLETGDAALLNADDHYPMQSVYKLPISMAVMDQIRKDDRSLDEKIGVTKADMVRQGQASPLRDKFPNGGEFTIRELIRYALVDSDGTASDVLLRVAGGPNAVQDYLSQIGIEDMHVVNSEKEMGADWNVQYQNWATPLAAVELLRNLNAQADGWHPPTVDERFNESKLILQLMFESTTGPNRIKALLPFLDLYKMKIVAHKTGTGGTKDGITSATNDIGIIYLPNGKHLAVAVFVSDSPADEKTREAVIARTAKAAWDRWSGASGSKGNSKLRKIKCATTKDSDGRLLCRAVMSKFDKEDDVTFREFEVTARDVDLNNDKRDETVAWISSWGGTSGQSLFILSRMGKVYRKLWEQDTTWTPVVLLPSITNGWRDLAFLVTGGGVEEHFELVKHDGRQYKAVASQRGQPKGEILLDKDWNPSTFGPVK